MSSIKRPTEAYESLKAQDTWNRNEKEDMKLAIEYLYEFHEKLSKLHPECTMHMNHMLQERR